jgi:hypothetical protein
VSENQYYEFLAVDRPLTTAEQAEVRQLSTRARITATSFTNEYQRGDSRGSLDELMRRYYDAHLYYANWGTHRVMFRLPRTLLDPEVAEQYCVDPQVTVSATADHVILDMTSEDESSDWEEDLAGRRRRRSGGSVCLGGRSTWICRTRLLPWHRADENQRHHPLTGTGLVGTQVHDRIHRHFTYPTKHGLVTVAGKPSAT